jgi:hypothetical protein
MAAGAAVLLAATAGPLFACSIIPLFWVREEQQPALVLQALRDSVYLGTFVPWRFDPETDEVRLAPEEAERVYGQVLRVREVVARGSGLPPEVRPGARVVVLHWGLGASCGPEAPYRAYTAPPGHLAFVLPARRALPPSASWQPARGASAPTLPVLEVSAHERPYVAWYHRHRGTQSRIHRLFRPRPMTVEEYAAMYRAMPGRQEWLRDPRGTAGRVARWGQANPRLVRREPARRMVESLEYTVERMEDEAAEARER